MGYTECRADRRVGRLWVGSDKTTQFDGKSHHMLSKHVPASSDSSTQKFKSRKQFRQLLLSLRQTDKPADKLADKLTDGQCP